jgi:hypothetical protein
MQQDPISKKKLKKEKEHKTFFLCWIKLICISFILSAKAQKERNGKRNIQKGKSKQWQDIRREKVRGKSPVSPTQLNFSQTTTLFLSPKPFHLMAGMISAVCLIKVPEALLLSCQKAGRCFPLVPIKYHSVFLISTSILPSPPPVPSAWLFLPFVLCGFHSDHSKHPVHLYLSTPKGLCHIHSTHTPPTHWLL